VLAALLIALPSLPVMAAGGDLDTSFDGDGRAFAGASGSVHANAVAVQDDGKIVVGGFATGSGMVLGRFNANGTVDNSFGTNGVEFVGTGDQGRAMAIQSDGKILLAGDAYVDHGGDENPDLAVARFNSDGSLDPTFGTGGMVTTDINGSNNWANAIALQSDGRIVLAGNGLGSNHQSDNFAVARYNADGTLDTSFSSDGWLTTDFKNESEDIAYGVAIQADGLIVVSGESSGSDIKFAVARYTSTGGRDNTFSGDGRVTTAVATGTHDFGRAVVIQPNRRIVVGGYAYGNNQEDFALVRYRTDGTLDLDFSGDGKLTTSFGQEYGFERVRSLRIQSSDRRIVAGGSSQSDFALARYNTNGSLDTSFSTDGKLRIDMFDQDEGNGVALQADGRILIAGTSGINVDFDLAVARVLAI
jgi:uncharacterized delta-60 repeat protein